MRNLADKLTQFIMVKGIIHEEDYALYHYGLQTGMEVMLCVIISVVIAAKLGILMQSFVVAVVLFALRAYICGIHMKKYIACLISSTVLITVGPFLVNNISLSKNEIIAVSIVLMALLHKLSYVTIAYHSDEEEIQFFTKQRKRILSIVFVVILVLWLWNKSGYLMQICYALTVACLSVVLEIIRIKVTKEKNV
ncbi:MAG: accessory gene regulator B family protein [Lachnospiraceae bacterium]|nr:accessory gene regulator B family protein [Lachnospiraceae bacterium]